MDHGMSNEWYKRWFRDYQEHARQDDGINN